MNQEEYPIGYNNSVEFIKATINRLQGRSGEQLQASLKEAADTLKNLPSDEQHKVGKTLANFIVQCSRDLSQPQSVYERDHTIQQIETAGSLIRTLEALMPEQSHQNQPINQKLPSFRLG